MLRNGFYQNGVCLFSLHSLLPLEPDSLWFIDCHDGYWRHDQASYTQDVERPSPAQGKVHNSTHPSQGTTYMYTYTRAYETIYQWHKTEPKCDQNSKHSCLIHKDTTTNAETVDNNEVSPPPLAQNLQIMVINYMYKHEKLNM